MYAPLNKKTAKRANHFRILTWKSHEKTKISVRFGCSTLGSKPYFKMPSESRYDYLKLVS